LFPTKRSAIPPLFPKGMQLIRNLEYGQLSNDHCTETKKMLDSRFDLLNSIRFVWNVLDNQWDEMFQRLIAYKNQHGSTLVPKGYEADTQLARWVRAQWEFTIKTNFL
jgi:hypothetical protein